MKRLLSVFVLLLLAAVPAMATDTGVGIGVDIETEDFAPLIWMCDHRLVFDDNVQPGRFDGSDLLYERTQNYAFEGEQIMWLALVMDKNGIEKIEDVFVTIGDDQGEGNDIEVNCDVKNGISREIFDRCNARIGEEELTWEDYKAGLGDTMAAYTCTFTVESPDGGSNMYGEYWVTGEVTDLDGLSNTWDENEYWFLNPVIALTVSDDLYFEDVRPGTSAYSDTILVGNDADEGSGVMMDMFVSGTDFYDSSSSGAKCPTTNQLLLGNGDSRCDETDPFCYYATLGAYSTQTDGRSDVEGYVGINYGDHFDSTFYGDHNGDTDGHEIIQSPFDAVGYFAGNILAPGAEIAMTFRLDLPEPCNGDFDSGSIFFWGEAI